VPESAWASAPSPAQTPDLVELFPDADLPRLPVWITAHERLRHTPRVDALWRPLPRVSRRS
jgi:hypothetical protein